MGKDELIGKIVELAEENSLGKFDNASFERDVYFLLKSYDIVERSCVMDKTLDENSGLHKHGVTQRRELLNAFAKHYNKLPRKDYIGEDDITDFLL